MTCYSVIDFEHHLSIEEQEKFQHSFEIEVPLELNNLRFGLMMQWDAQHTDKLEDDWVVSVHSNIADLVYNVSISTKTLNDAILLKMLLA